MDQIETQIHLLVQTARCIHLKNVLTAANPNPSLNFWRLLVGGLMDLSVIEWTKIFGSNAEPTHWKGVISDHDKFRADLLNYVGCSESEWAAYWTQMKNYRNEFAAHHSTSPTVQNYPVLELALKSCYFYYSTLISNLRAAGDSSFPDDLESYCSRFSSQASSIAIAAVDATSQFQELVF